MHSLIIHLLHSYLDRRFHLFQTVISVLKTLILEVDGEKQMTGQRYFTYNDPQFTFLR